MEIIVETQDVGVPDERRDNIMNHDALWTRQPCKVNVMLGLIEQKKSYLSMVLRDIYNHVYALMLSYTIKSIVQR